MGTKVEKQIEETKFKITILEMLYKLGEMYHQFSELYDRTRLDIYARIMERIQTKAKELYDLL
jgi:hypothetical protein